MNRRIKNTLVVITCLLLAGVSSRFSSRVPETVPLAGAPESPSSAALTIKAAPQSSSTVANPSLSAQPSGRYTASLGAGVLETIRQNAADNRILFCNFEFQGEKVTLAQAAGNEGHLVFHTATQPNPGHLLVEFYGDGEAPVTSLLADDPQNRFVEWENEAHPGSMRSRLVAVDTGEVFLRLPGVSSARKIALYRFQATAQNHRQLLAEFNLQ